MVEQIGSLLLILGCASLQHQGRRPADPGQHLGAAHAWERRYGVPSLQRSDHGHRLYSQRDVAIIKWLEHLYRGWPGDPARWRSIFCAMPAARPRRGMRRHSPPLTTGWSATRATGCSDCRSPM